MSIIFQEESKQNNDIVKYVEGEETTTKFSLELLTSAEGEHSMLPIMQGMALGTLLVVMPAIMIMEFVREAQRPEPLPIVAGLLTGLVAMVDGVIGSINPEDFNDLW